MTGTFDSRPAVFVDKDDTLVRDVPYSACPALIDWMPGALEGLGRLQAAGFEIVVVTNQSGIAQGRYDEKQLRRYLRHLEQLLLEAGVGVAGIDYCPHHPDAKLAAYRRMCECRKPNPGMLIRAAARHRLDLSRSWMLGDLLDDVEAGTRAGLRTVLLAVHDDQDSPGSGPRRPDFVASSLTAAAALIVAASEAVA